MELRRPRGIATYITFSLVNSSGAPISGVTGVRPQYATFTDGISPNTIFSTISNATITEIGSSGWYYASLTATEMANDYIVFVASPTSGTSLSANYLINCTVVASVTNVGSVSYAVPINWASISGQGTSVNLTGTLVASVNNPVGILWSSITSPGATNVFSNTTIATVTSVQYCFAATPTGVATRVELADTVWNRILTASPTTAGAAGLMVAQSYATMSTGPLATVTAVNYPVPLNWASISGQGSTANLTGTSVASINNPVPTNWASISNVTAAVTFSGTVIGTTTDIGQTGADHIIDTNLALGGRGNTRNVQNALRLLRNRRAITAGVMNTATLTSYQENDTSAAWTAVVSTASVVGFSDVDAT
jgi:hypothetical protein